MKKSRLVYAVPPLITLLLYSVVLACKGIYPFGDRTIDYYDMAQQMAPFYYHIYDALHAAKGLFFDWYTALGINMSSASNSSNLSLFNLFFLLVRRENLLQSLSVFTGIKIICMSFSMYLVLSKITSKAHGFFHIIAAVGYAFCGFVLMHYTICPWLDTAALFPLLMYFYGKTLRKGRIRGYVIILGLIFISSYYQGSLILVFLFLYTGAQIACRYIFDGKEAKGLHLTELGIATALGLALSSFIVIPQFMQMFGSSRFQNGSGGEGLLAGYIDILSHVRGDYSTRWWILLGVSFPAAVILTGLIRCRKNHRLVFTAVFLLVLTLAQLFIESINLMMHFGSYVHYPIRNGYIIYFVFAYLMCLFAGELYPDGITVRLISLVSFLPAVAGFILFAMWINGNKGMPYENVFHVSAAIMAGTFVFYLVVLNLRGRVGTLAGYCGFSVGIIACEILCYGYMLLGQPDFVLGYAEAPEQSNNYIGICDQIRTGLDLKPERLHRVKNPDESLNANYGFVLMQPALSSWTAMADPEEIEGASKWGYSYQYTRLLDSGGTVFSDALIGIRNVISCLPMDERLYENAGSTEVTVDGKTGDRAKYTLYRCRYTFPFGVKLKDLKEDGWEQADAAERHNRIYKAMAAAYGISDNEDIASWLAKDTMDPQMEVKVNEPVALYLFGAGGDRDERSCTVTIRREDGTQTSIAVPDIGASTNIYYPAYFNNNSLYLGSYENETISVVIERDPDKGEAFPVSVMGLSLEKMDRICEELAGPDDKAKAGNTWLSLLEANDDGRADRLLLPLAYSRGWKVAVNGRNAASAQLDGLFTMIELTDGQNDIRMKYRPPGMMTGALISIFALVIMSACVIMIRMKKSRVADVKERMCRSADRILTRIYIAVFGTALIFVYVIPFIYGIYYYLRRML